MHTQFGKIVKIVANQFPDAGNMVVEHPEFANIF